jgi:pyruvate,water dikinase
MPWEVKVPAELEGWEDMYPSHYLFSEERKDWEGRQFWYLDKIHAPDPMPPWDLIFQEAWQIALAQNNTRVFCIPPAQGVAHRLVGCYMYISAVEPPPPEVVSKKAEIFQKRVPYIFEHYPELWEKWLDKFTALGKELQSIAVPVELPAFEPDEVVLPAPRGCYTSYDLIEAYDRLIDGTFKAWQYHFEYLNLSYLAFLMFSDTARKIFPGITESAIGKMVAGVPAAMFRPEEELCKLARLAFTMPLVKEILKQDIPAQQKIEMLEKTPEGREWLKAFEEKKDPWFYVSCGSGWFHYEGSWINRLDVPFGYLKSYVERLERGERIERFLEDIQSEKDKLVEEYKKLIRTEDDRRSFEEAYRTCMMLYPYSEGHIFWVEHWFHTILFEKMREFGRLLVKCGVLKDAEDIFYFNRFEIPPMLEEVAVTWALGEGVPPRAGYWQRKVEKRKEILEAAKRWSPPPALGIPPQEIAEPFTVMLWGVTQEKVQEWLSGVSAAAALEVAEIKGFAASAGVVEGKARVVKSLDEVGALEPGEILVAPTTNPSWSPVFTKIKAAVTDIGGLTSHAAIVCREYGLPAVTGTGVATTVLRTGDTVRVDGGSGVVTIIQRAQA